MHKAAKLKSGTATREATVYTLNAAAVSVTALLSSSLASLALHYCIPLPGIRYRD